MKGVGVCEGDAKDANPTDGDFASAPNPPVLEVCPKGVELNGCGLEPNTGALPSGGVWPKAGALLPKVDAWPKTGVVVPKGDGFPKSGVPVFIAGDTPKPGVVGAGGRRESRRPKREGEILYFFARFANIASSLPC